MGILDRVNKLSNSVTESSKSVQETSNLKRKIIYERERIQEIEMDIGRKFYEDPHGDHGELVALCADIDDRKRRIASMMNDLSSLKGFRICPNCGARFDEKYTFGYCGKCGTKLDALTVEG